MKKNEKIDAVTSHAKLFRDHLKNPNSLKLNSGFFLTMAVKKFLTLTAQGHIFIFCDVLSERICL